MKNKVKSTNRTYDHDGYMCRAACVCFQIVHGELNILLISSQRPNRWIIPGGGIDPGEDPETAAQREALEEAGIYGTLIQKLKVIDNDIKTTRTHLFAFKITEFVSENEWQESHNRKRLLCPLIRALDLTSEQVDTKNYLQIFLDNFNDLS